jgi:precorrin-6B methylase 2
MQNTSYARASRLDIRAVAVGAALALVCAFPAVAQQRTAPALDVPYVPTPDDVVAKMLDIANVTKDDYVIDLGSGDGRIAIAAAKRGAKAFGVDLNPVRVEEAQANAKAAGVEDRVEFKEANIFETDFSDATVLTMYLLSSVNLKLRPQVLEMKPGTRVVSHAFDMGEWEPDEVANVDGRTVYYWVVPARVEGKWKVNRAQKAFTVNFKQEFQNLTGTAEMDGKEVPVEDAKLEGTRITFSLADGNGGKQRFEGRVDGDRIKPAPEKQASGDEKPADWEATRAS